MPEGVAGRPEVQADRQGRPGTSRPALDGGGPQDVVAVFYGYAHRPQRAAHYRGDPQGAPYRAEGQGSGDEQVRTAQEEPLAGGVMPYPPVRFSPHEMSR